MDPHRRQTNPQSVSPSHCLLPLARAARKLDIYSSNHLYRLEYKGCTPEALLSFRKGLLQFDVVAEASPRGAPPAQPAEVLDVTTAAASDCGQKRARSPQPGTGLLARHSLMISKTLSTVLEGAARPGARVVAGRESGSCRHCRCCPKRGHATPGPHAARGSSDNTDEWSA
eukprot:351467-Chlamydomonas_euryale.AAC.1